MVAEKSVWGGKESKSYDQRWEKKNIRRNENEETEME